MIKQIIREMESNIKSAEDKVIDAIAREKHLAKELEYHRNQSDVWRKKAETAITGDNEELARSAIVRKKEHDR